MADLRVVGRPVTWSFGDLLFQPLFRQEHGRRLLNTRKESRLCVFPYPFVPMSANLSICFPMSVHIPKAQEDFERLSGPERRLVGPERKLEEPEMRLAGSKRVPEGLQNKLGGS